MLVISSLRVEVPLTTGGLALSPGVGSGACRFDGPPVSKMIAFQPGAAACARSLHTRVFGFLATCGRLLILCELYNISCAVRLPTRRYDRDGHFSVLATQHDFSRVVSDAGVLATAPPLSLVVATVIQLTAVMALVAMLRGSVADLDMGPMTMSLRTGASGRTTLVR